MLCVGQSNLQTSINNLHSATGAAPFLQDISYKYNERGWLKRINDPAIAPTATRMFSEQLNYDSVGFAATPKFNGNITEQMFQAYNSIQFPGQQHVVYAYDPMNRLNSGISTTGLNENITYDNIGNITALTRGGITGYYGYYYGRLINVTGHNTNYQYDVNGNMTHDGKNNADLTYNLLNLPQTATAATPTSIGITYTYDANGQKLRKVSNGSSTDYISGIQYKPDAATIDFIQTEEGRAINSGGNYTYEYTLTDHLGNNRVTFDQTNGKVGEEDYYPFGLNVHRQINAANKYLYNKKELQDELTEYDYGARFYDPTIGRFTTIDPLAEESRRWTPYGYGDDNSIRNIDPDGMEAEDANDDPGDLIQPTSDHFRHEHPILAVIHDIAYTITDVTGLKDLENSIGHSGDKNVSTKDKVGNIFRATVNVLSLGEEGEGEGFHGEGPTIEPYNREAHYGKTPTKADRKALGADKTNVVDHNPPLVKRYHEGDPSTGEKPGHKMTDAERKASANDRSRMKLQPQKESQQQGGAMSKYSKDKNKENGH